MNITSYRYLISVILCSVLLGCSSGPKTSTTREIGLEGNLSTTPTIEPPTSTLSPTPEPTLTATTTSQPTSTPTLTFTPSPTPLGMGSAVIDETNFMDIEKFLTLGKGRVQSVQVSEDGRFQMIHTPRGIHLYETETIKEIGFFPDYGAVTIIPGKSQIIALTPETQLAIIDLATGVILQELAPLNALSIGTIAFSQDVSHMAVNVLQPHPIRLNWTSSRIDVYNLDNGELISQLESDLMGSCSQLTISLDNSLLAAECSPSGGGLGRLFQFDIQSGFLNWTVPFESVTSFPFSRDGTLIATSLSAPRYILIRRTSDGSEVSRVSGGAVVNNPFSPDNKYFLSQTNSDILVWNVSSSQKFKTIRTDIPGQPTFSDDGEYILVSGGKRAYRTSDFSLDENYQAPEDESDLTSQNLPEVIPVEAWLSHGHLSGVMGVELFNDDRLFVWGVRNYQDLWEEQTLWWWYPDQDSLEEIPLGKNAGYPAFSPSKEMMAVCTQEGLKLITIENGNIEDLGSCRSSFSPVAFSGDGKRLFLGSGIVIDEFDIETRSVLSQLRGHDYNIGHLRSSDDGNYLFSTSADEISGGRESIIWQLDPLTFTKKWFITYGSESNLSEALFTPDNANLVVIFGEKVSVWRVSDGWYLANFDGNALTFLADGKLGVVGLPVIASLPDGNIGLRKELFDFYGTSNWKKVGPLDADLTDLAMESMDFELMRILFSEAGAQSGDVMHLTATNEGRVLISVTSGDVIEFWRVP